MFSSGLEVRVQPTTDEILENLLRLDELLDSVPETPQVQYLEIARSVSFTSPLPRHRTTDIDRIRRERQTGH
jgi:hypothetical protein